MPDCPSDSNTVEVALNRREFIVGAFATGLFVSLPRSAKSAAVTEPTPAPAKTITKPLNVTINGKSYALQVDSRTTLLDCLREDVKLTGAKKGCDHGQCGACTVHVNGKRINSCLTLALQCEGKKVTTIEGLAANGDLHPMQTAFIKHDAYQCGFCTPGQIMSAVALLNEPVGGSEQEVRECMSGNICRCGAYRNILDAISDVRAKGKSNVTV